MKNASILYAAWLGAWVGLAMRCISPIWQPCPLLFQICVGVYHDTDLIFGFRIPHPVMNCIKLSWSTSVSSMGSLVGSWLFLDSRSDSDPVNCCHRRLPEDWLALFGVRPFFSTAVWNFASTVSFDAALLYQHLIPVESWASIGRVNPYTLRQK